MERTACTGSGLKPRIFRQLISPASSLQLKLHSCHLAAWRSEPSKQKISRHQPQGAAVHRHFASPCFAALLPVCPRAAQTSGRP